MKDEAWYIELLLKEADQSLSPEERQELDDWLKDSTANQEKAAKIREAYGLGRKARVDNALNLDEEYAAVKRKIGRYHLRISFRKWSVAAAILVLIVAGIIGLLQKSEAGKTLVIQGPIEQYRLEDGSEVWLKEDSKLEVQYTKDVRGLTFTGGGYFEVSPNPDRPFKIKTTPGTVSVIGTSFEVNTHQTMLQVMVATGRVRLTTNQQEWIELAAGESGQITESHLEKTPNHQPAGAWLLPPVPYQQTELAEVLKEIEAKYHIIFSTDFPDVLQCKVTFTLDYPEQAVLFQILETLLDVKIVQEGESQYRITGRGC